MSKPRRSSCQCRVDEFERLRLARGYTIEELAKRAAVSKKTVERLIKGERVDLHTIRLLAEKLGVPPSAIQAGQLIATTRVSQTSTFKLRVAVDGVCTSPTQAAEVGRMGSDIVSRLESTGVTVSSYREALIQTTDASGVSSDPEGFVLVGIAWRSNRGYRGHRLALIRADKYAAFVNAIAECVFRADALSAYGNALPADLSSVQTIWDVIDKQPDADWDTDNAKAFTVVPMPNDWRYVDAGDRAKQLHTREVLVACHRESAYVSRNFTDISQHEQPMPAACTVVVIRLKWRADDHDVEATAIVSPTNYRLVERAIRSHALDLKRFEQFGRLVIHNPSDDWTFWHDPTKAPALALAEKDSDPDRVYIDSIRFWDPSQRPRDTSNDLTAANFM